MPSVPRKATQFHAVQNRADYATRLPVQNNIKSNKTWFAMQNDMVPNPAPSKEAIYQEISKMRPKRALTRRIVVASQTGDLKTLRKILWGNRRVSVNRMYRKSKKSAALTPLCWAALNGHVGIVECLLDGVAEDPEQIELRLLEELSMVLRGEKAPVEQPSLTKPSLAKSSYATTWGSSMSSMGSQSLTRTANIETCDSEGRTALMLATYGGHFNVVCALLERGSKILVVDRYGRNVLDYTRQNKSKEIKDVIKNTLRERHAIELQLQKEEELRMKEYFAAILKRVAGGSKKNQLKTGKNKSILKRKQRPMTAPNFGRRRNNNKSFWKTGRSNKTVYQTTTHPSGRRRPHTAQRAISRYALPST